MLTLDGSLAMENSPASSIGHFFSTGYPLYSNSQSGDLECRLPSLMTTELWKLLTVLL
jgi:hypothetical protein